MMDYMQAKNIERLTYKENIGTERYMQNNIYMKGYIYKIIYLLEKYANKMSYIQRNIDMQQIGNIHMKKILQRKDILIERYKYKKHIYKGV